MSACDTALTSTNELIDEAIHLTTAFQLAGFPHVIGTLWEINDQLAVIIADTFYATLRTSQGSLDTSQAARALHDAVRSVREELPHTRPCGPPTFTPAADPIFCPDPRRGAVNLYMDEPLRR